MSGSCRSGGSPNTPALATRGATALLGARGLDDLANAWRGSRLAVRAVQEQRPETWGMLAPPAVKSAQRLGKGSRACGGRCCGARALIASDGNPWPDGRRRARAPDATALARRRRQGARTSPSRDRLAIASRWLIRAFFRFSCKSSATNRGGSSRGCAGSGCGGASARKTRGGSGPSDALGGARAGDAQGSLLALELGQGRLQKLSQLSCTWTPRLRASTEFDFGRSGVESIDRGTEPRQSAPFVTHAPRNRSRRANDPAGAQR